ncbi:MAG: GPW/gp25 family protein [Chitinophagaceae bacterium]|nr:GPW/gp25 family protein [Chitinophagaceae bacterium]
MMEVNTDIIGIGWSFPPAFNRAAGDVFMTGGEEDIQNSLKILLNTAFGERVMRSDYGCDLRRFLFDPANASMEAYIRKIVEEAILYFEARIRPEKITLDVMDGVMEINIEYTIKTTNSRSNYVYPFYLKEASL